VLASASPRRRAILAATGVTFEAIDVDLDESRLTDEAPEETAVRLAVAKALAGASARSGSTSLGADTVVVLEGRALGKPIDEDDAVRTLKQLRGRFHRVLTGVAVAAPSVDDSNPPTFSRLASTRVWMRHYSDREIDDYVASGDPLDKAGSYAIQSPAFRPVERIEGCFLTVVGLPLPDVIALLGRAGVSIPPIHAEALARICPYCTDTAALLQARRY
jgi:MAF protein